MTLMLKDERDFRILNFDGRFDLEEFSKTPAMSPFNDKVIEYLDALSSILRGNHEAKRFPDVATFSFYCRKSNLLQMKEKFENGRKTKLGRGIVFHVAPSNVPVNFAYSLLAGLITGNSNIVRVPSKDFEQVEIISDAIIQLSKQECYSEISKRIALVTYDRKGEATKLFSSICDVRIIWGGDGTIEEIRKNKMPARSFDIPFADRYSFCVINADEYVLDKSHEKISRGFFNDTYLMDQNACTSPQLVIWIGEGGNVELGKEIFWNSLYKIVKEHYEIQPIIAIDKLDNFLNQVVEIEGSRLIPGVDNLLWRIEIDKLNERLDSFAGKGGYFVEYHAKNLGEISSTVSRKYQTLAYFGFTEEKMEEFVSKTFPSGIDRIVPIGRTLDFSMIWDGFNLIESLSRTVEIWGK